jgi:hypothetical protein
MAHAPWWHVAVAFVMSQGSQSDGPHPKAGSSICTHASPQTFVSEPHPPPPEPPVPPEPPETISPPVPPDPPVTIVPPEPPTPPIPALPPVVASPPEPPDGPDVNDVPHPEVHVPKAGSIHPEDGAPNHIAAAKNELTAADERQIFFIRLFICTTLLG